MGALPPPCPPECVNMLPTDMWEAYWAYSQNGKISLPASVPRRLSRFDKRWTDAVRRWKERHNDNVPKLWKGYWGKFMNDPKPLYTSMDTLPDAFWLEYLERHPDGHWEDETHPDSAPAPWTPGGNGEDKHGYWLIKGRLCFKHKNGITYEATGVDAFPPM